MAFGVGRTKVPSDLISDCIRAWRRRGRQSAAAAGRSSRYDSPAGTHDAPGEHSFHNESPKNSWRAVIHSVCRSDDRFVDLAIGVIIKHNRMSKLCRKRLMAGTRSNRSQTEPIEWICSGEILQVQAKDLALVMLVTMRQTTSGTSDGSIGQGSSGPGTSTDTTQHCFEPELPLSHRKGCRGMDAEFDQALPETTQIPPAVPNHQVGGKDGIEVRQCKMDITLVRFFWIIGVFQLDASIYSTVGTRLPILAST